MVFSQQINMIKKLDSAKTKTVRIDKKITIKTFDGEKYNGEWQVIDEQTILVQNKEVKKDNIMMISGFVMSNSKDKAVGIGLTVGAGIVFPVAVYYILGGIAWGFSNGIFVGATLLAFDLLLAYAGTTMMGVLSRRFSTFNWEIELSTQPAPIQLPVQVD
jgi:small nuclear ribonucleoprotein (snRNP)-like protein